MNMAYLLLGRDKKKVVNSKEKEYFIIDIFLELPAHGSDKKQVTCSWCLILLLKSHWKINSCAVCTVTNCSLLQSHNNTLACYF